MFADTFVLITAICSENNANVLKLRFKWFHVTTLISLTGIYERNKICCFFSIHFNLI